MCNGIGNRNPFAAQSTFAQLEQRLAQQQSQNPLDQFRQMLGGAAQGGQLDPRMLRAVISQLDRQIVQQLLGGQQAPMCGPMPQPICAPQPQPICAPQPQPICAQPQPQPQVPAQQPLPQAPPPPAASKIKKGREWKQGMVDASGKAIPNPPKQGSNAHYDKSGNFTKWTSPLTLDMNGNGKVGTTSMEGGKKFDINGDGKVDQTAWAEKGDGVLAFDRDGDGVAGKDGKELFGDATDLGDGKKHANGFEALKAAALQKLGPQAVAGGSLKGDALAMLEKPVAQGGIGLTVMVDGKQVAPSQAGITEIKLGYTEAGTNADENGNQHRQVGAGFVRNGQAGKMDDVWFANQ